jgi:hypothetical protein
MGRVGRSIAVLGLGLGVGLSPAGACGPFLYENAELDRLSLVDPGILNNPEWVSFLAFASPAFGQPQAGTPEAQPVIQARRLGLTADESATNLVTEYGPGEDPVSVAANEAWWGTYFQSVRHRKARPDEVAAALYGPDRPGWLVPEDRAYLAALARPSDDPATLKDALAGARSPRLPLGLRHRWAFWAVRALALAGSPETLTIFREFCPGAADDLPLARAQGWAAQVVADSDPDQAAVLWLDLLVRWPALRAQTFLSLGSLPPGTLEARGTPEALVARFFLDGRDFSPETLGAVSRAEKAAGGDGTWTETVFYAMAEQIEGEAGVYGLFGLVDPREVTPQGLFTPLVDQAEALVTSGTQPATRTWWTLAAYLALFDGTPGRAGDLLARAQALPGTDAQVRETDLVGALVQMDAEKNQDWSPDLQRRVVAALDWGQTLNGPGHNRGLYHSVAVLAAQKELARGHTPQAVLAFALVRTGPWSNPYKVEADDGFWTTGWRPNHPVNLMMDALVSDADIAVWRGLLRAPDLDPLTARLVSHPFLSDRDLTWWEAHRALRRGQGDRALALLKTLGGDGSVDSGVFPRRAFSYSFDLDPLDPAAGRGMRTVGPLTLASLMAQVEADARDRPSSRTLLARGLFWLSLQLSGLPLLFAQPPKVISFVNGNFEYYGYDGRDLNRTVAVVGDYPLGRPGQTDAWTERLRSFSRTEFSTLDRARAAFEAVVARHEDLEAEFRALLFLQALDHNRYEALDAPRYATLPLAETYRTTCESWRVTL